MKVLNLRCAQDHRFEGWFNSDDDFLSQGQRGLIACPLCDDHTITRLPTAPRLNVLTQRGEPSSSSPLPLSTNQNGERSDRKVQADFLTLAREVIQQTEDVGDGFAEEARRIHYGEAESRGIRGMTSVEDAHALREEGIEVFSMPLPEILKSSLQ